MKNPEKKSKKLTFFKIFTPQKLASQKIFRKILCKTSIFSKTPKFQVIYQENAKKYRKITFSEKSLFLGFFWEFFRQAFFYSKNFFGIFGIFRKMAKNRPKNGPKNHENFKIISVNKGTQFFKNRDFFGFFKKVF